MGKRVWLILGLIVVEFVCSWSAWNPAYELGMIHLQILSLVVMGAILTIGLHSFWVSQREVLRCERAEAEFRSEQASLEHRIEVRTSELQTEVEVRSRAEDRNQRQKRVLELLAIDAPIEDIFMELTASVAVQRRSWESAIHLADAGTRSLKLIATSKVSERLKHYLGELAASFPDAPETRAWESGKPYFIGSMTLEHCPWSEFLASNGIRSAWSLPLMLSDGKTVGTLTVYSRLFGVPDDLDLEILDSAVRLATLVMDVHRMHRELLRKAFQDELTGVANRRAGEIRLADAIARARSRDESFGVLLIDLDRFKRLNDLYGHACGDQVLCEVAKRIAKHPPVSGSVARMGGDEFLVLIESCPGDQHAREVAADLAALISEPMELGSGVTTVGASIGIAIFPRDGQTLDELERHADAAMYQAKRRSISWCAFSSAMHEAGDLAISIEEGLREALDPKTGRDMFEVLYQPIYLIDGKLTAFEALLRFRHPKLGAIPPVKFIPIAEETKLIIPIGRWVLRQVCKQTVAWKVAGYRSVRVGVNISAQQWGRDDFVDEFRSVIRECGAPAHALSLELTESVVMQNATQGAAHMRALRDMGVRVAMDDFGTGYSSLSYLHRLPMDVLKIDSSFIARLGQADDSRAIVESVISMAHLLRMTTIAEGVETDAQLSMLTEMGCDAVQGFLFARPMPSAEAADLICSTAAVRRIVGKDATPMNHAAPSKALQVQLGEVLSSS